MFKLLKKKFYEKISYDYSIAVEPVNGDSLSIYLDDELKKLDNIELVIEKKVIRSIYLLFSILLAIFLLIFMNIDFSDYLTAFQGVIYKSIAVIMIAPIFIYCVVNLFFGKAFYLRIDRGASTLHYRNNGINGKIYSANFYIDGFPKLYSKGSNVGVTPVLTGTSLFYCDQKNDKRIEIGIESFSHTSLWSFYVWYMDKNRPLPPGTAFDPYREADDARRAAEGNPPPLYPSTLPDSYFEQFTHKGRLKAQKKKSKA